MTGIHALVNDAAAMREALRNGADPRATDAAGNTALHAAAWSADPDVVRLLLAHGADPRARNRRGVPVLHEAVRRDRDGMAAVLVDAGAPADDRADDDRSTPLHWAAKGGRAALVRLLLANGADVDARDRSGRTPLQWLLLRNPTSAEHRATVRTLLSAGAAHTLETAVALGGAEHVRRWLARGASPVAQVDDGGSFLALAAERGDGEVVRLLLDAGAAPDGEAFDARSPLLRAAAARRPEVAEMLLGAGADPEWGGRDGFLPLDVNVAGVGYRRENDPVAALLLAHGARPTPLWAAAVGDPALLEEALRGGRSVDGGGAHGVTPLLLATQAENETMVEALLRAGAKPSGADELGRTPLHVAAEAPFLRDGAVRTRIARRLLAAGADPNARGYLGRTPLHSALAGLHSTGVNVDVVALLVAAGADPQARDDAGQTPMEVDLPEKMHHGPGQSLAEMVDAVRRRDAAAARVAAILAGAGDPSSAAPRESDEEGECRCCT